MTEQVGKEQLNIKNALVYTGSAPEINYFVFGPQPSDDNFIQL